MVRLPARYAAETASFRMRTLAGDCQLVAAAYLGFSLPNQ